MQNRFFDQFLRYRNLKTLTYAQYAADLKIPLVLILTKNPGFAKPPKRVLANESTEVTLLKESAQKKMLQIFLPFGI